MELLEIPVLMINTHVLTVHVYQWIWFVLVELKLIHAMMVHILKIKDFVVVLKLLKISRTEVDHVKLSRPVSHKSGVKLI